MPPTDRGTRFTFVRAPHSGCVHILPSDDGPGPGEPLAGMAAFLTAMLSRTRMLCGVRLLIGWAATGTGSGMAAPVAVFSDAALCRRCMDAMGAQAPLIFEQMARDERQRAGIVSPPP